ncbi:MAG: peptide deformylase [Gammaproteobacteria bacterium]|nr:MAG: peptide deformylase [Gammaproteobacteria bacterium]
MAFLEILHFPDPRLRKKATPVDEVNEQVRQTVKDMFETMYEAPGIGLAATQVNIQQQIIVIDISEDKSESLCLINPQIIKKDGEEEMQEGCLSVPGIFENVQRAENITVQALDQQGVEFTLDADGLLAVCIQHEMDHLDGKLFVDYLSPLKKQRIKKKMLKLKKLEPSDQDVPSQTATII